MTSTVWVGCGFFDFWSRGEVGGTGRASGMDAKSSSPSAAVRRRGALVLLHNVVDVQWTTLIPANPWCSAPLGPQGAHCVFSLVLQLEPFRPPAPHRGQRGTLERRHNLTCVRGNVLIPPHPQYSAWLELQGAWTCFPGSSTTTPQRRSGDSAGRWREFTTSPVSRGLHSYPHTPSTPPCWSSRASARFPLCYN